MTKAPPHSNQAEIGVLGAMLLGADTETVKAEHFYHEKHQLIFKAIKQLLDEGVEPDLVSLQRQLQKNGHLELIGGMPYIAKLNQEVATKNNLEKHALIVLEMYFRRDMIYSSFKIQKENYDLTKDVFDSIEKLQGNIDRINSLKKGELESKSENELIDEVERDIEDLHSGKVKRLITGLKELDNITNIEPTDLIVIGARPSQGKTALGLTIAEYLQKKTKVLFVSFEMSAKLLTKRRLSFYSNYTFKELDDPRFPERVGIAVEKLKENSTGNLIIDDRSDWHSRNIRGRIKRYAENGVKAVVFDYLQLIPADGRDKREKVANLSNTIKSVAKEFNVIPFVLAQLNRDSSGVIPKMENLKEAGEIEQDADHIWLVHRPETYGEMDFVHNGDSVTANGAAQLFIAKQRNGEANKARLLRFNKQAMKFENYISE